MAKSQSLTIKEISNIDIGLGIIMNQKLPITPSWRFGQWKESSEKTIKAANKKREELIKELGYTKEDGSIEVSPENKQKYFESYKLLMDERATIDIPEIPTSLLKDIPTNVRFTTLIGHYLNNDALKFKTERHSSLTNQQLLDMDLAISLIMNEVLPFGLALKLGEAKRKAEAVSIELKEKREELFKKHGTLNDKFDYEVTDNAKKKLVEDTLEKWLEEKAKPVDIPVFHINEFETSITDAKGEKQDLKFPLRFFTLFSSFVKEQGEEKKATTKKA